MNISFDKVAPPVAFVLVGFLMIIIGATGTVPFIDPQLTVDENILKTGFIFLGVTLVIAGPTILWYQYFKSGNNQREETDKSMSPKIFSDEYYGIKILKPEEGDITDNKFEVIGTYKNLPKGHAIWVCTFGGSDDNKHYWPQYGRAGVDYAGEGTWKSEVGWMGTAKDETGEFLVFTVGEDGSALFDYFKKAGDENFRTVKEKLGEGIQLWPSINKLTKDTVLCAKRKIRIG